MNQKVFIVFSQTKNIGFISKICLHFDESAVSGDVCDYSFLLPIVTLDNTDVILIFEI